MPPRKSKKSHFFKVIVYSSLVATFVFIGYLAWLWWGSRQLDFVHYKEFGIPIPADYAIHGIDVSRYQQRISWETVKAMQVNEIKLGFAFIKATEGNGNVDPYFKRNWKRAKDAGITRGAYHFFIASKDGKSQAKNFIEEVKLEPGDLPPVLDIEQLNGVPAITLKKEVKEWLDAIELYYGVKPIIYTNVEFYRQYLGSEFDPYLLWAAHYYEYNQPRIKRGWSFWQHSDGGRVNGILSKVDFNVFNGDSTTFMELLVD